MWEPPLISAHRGGADDVGGQNSLAAVERAVLLGCELVEVDVRTRPDGTPVLGHDAITADSPTLADAVVLLGERTALHLDLKVADPDATIVALAVKALGARRVVVTTARDADVRSLRRWADTHATGLLVGLSTSRRPAAGRTARVAARLDSLRPRTRLRRSTANLVVSHHVLARWWLARWAKRRGLPLLVWTVDRDDDLRRWLTDPRTWAVTTNRPARALELRAK